MLDKASLGFSLSFAFATLALAGENWPHWRGPALDGSSDSKDLPVNWSQTQNVRWKVKLPSASAATPTIWGDRIFVMSAVPREGGQEVPSHMGGRRREAEGRDLLVLCLSRRDGHELWRRSLDDGNAYYSKQNMSSPSPVTDGRRVWTVTGSGTVTALDVDGNVLWRRDLQEAYGRFAQDYGYASSPVLVDSRVIIEVLHGDDGQNRGYLVAFDAKSGEPAWKVDRLTDAEDESPDCYTSPVLMRFGDRTELIVGGADYVTAHDPATGKEIWRCGGLNPERNPRYRSVSSPLIVESLVLMSIRRGPMVAIRGGGRGDVTATHVAWTHPAAPDVPTPVSDGKHLYILHDPGQLTCLDVRTGEAKYVKERLPAGPYSASPLLADGRLYVMSENARTTVVAAGPEFKVLAENRLDEDGTLSSIAVAGRELFVRTAKHLYCISEAVK